MLEKKIVKNLISVFFGLSFLYGSTAGAFNDITHKYITKSSFETLAQMGDETPSDNELSCEDLSEIRDVSEFFKGDADDYEELFVNYSVQPDIDEIQGIYKYHFYNPVTETNFMNEKESALERFKSHFEKAVALYKEDSKTESYQELGRAVHFMEDMNAPVHTAYELPSDSVAKLRLHVEFEKVCDTVCEECVLNLALPSLKYYEINSLDSIARSAATLSADNFYYLEKRKADKEKISKQAISNAQKKVSGILYRFSKEVVK